MFALLRTDEVMNLKYELIMLRGYGRMGFGVKKLNNYVAKLAVRSHCGFGPQDTLGQAVTLSSITIERDRLEAFRSAVVRALRGVPRGQRALLVEVYLKNTARKCLCEKYSVAPRTMYRKLAAARSAFRQNLCLLGYTEKWMREVYGDIEWISEMLDGGGRENDGETAV